jgi:hypothetical protein
MTQNAGIHLTVVKVLAICCYKQAFSTIMVGLIFFVRSEKYSKLPLTDMYGQWGVMVK